MCIYAMYEAPFRLKTGVVRPDRTGIAPSPTG